jgi:hypothetical protein
VVNKGILLSSLFVLIHLCCARSHAEAYDWLRSSVNQFWFNQFVGNCENLTPQTNLDFLKAYAAGTCSRAPESAHINRSISKNLVTDLYFDKSLVEMAKQNQCQFDYWSALNTKDNSSYLAQDRANKKLGSQFEALKPDLKPTSYQNRGQILPTTESGTPAQQAQTAQRKIVDQLVEKAYEIAKKEREIKNFIATNPIYTPDPKKSSSSQVTQMYHELAVLENSFLMAEDPEVQYFVRNQLVARIKDGFKLGKEPDLKVMKEYFYSDKSDSFQARVVDKKMQSISTEQTDYAEIDGAYNDNYSFKVAAVQSGVGAKILSDSVNQNSNFSKLQCEMESKYGKGEKIASTANAVAIAGVTFAFGGGAMLLGKLAQIGIASQRTVRVAHVISSVANTSISLSEIAQGLLECPQPHFRNKDSSTCARVASVKEKGIDIQINSEIDHSNCLTDLGLAAISGAIAFKAAAKAKQLKRDQQLLQLGLSDRYQNLKRDIGLNPNLTPAQRKQLIAELDRSISLSSMENFPRQEFIKLLAKEEPEDLLQALTQINTSAAGSTWRERVKTWISTKGFNKQEADDLESCLVDNASKTSKCNSVEKPGQT